MGNSRADRHRRGNRQRGAALVEMAIVISLFLVLIFGIIEFARAIFEWSRLVEATRAGARYAIVNDPACSIYKETNDNDYKCPGSGPERALDCSGDSDRDEITVEVAGNCLLGATYTLGDAKCKIVEQMVAIQPLIYTSEAKVMITYACTDAGFAGLDQKVPAVTVKVEDVKYGFIAAGLLGLYDPNDPGKWPITMPAFATTRTGEDLDTVVDPPVN